MNHLQKSSVDFNAVRDGRTSPDFYIDVDLSNIGDQIFNIAGNSFYVDANPSDGNAIVYFQDTDKLSGPTPFYVSPGFIARIPFTQIRVRNSSQPGKKIRIVYGTDTDFQPGSVSQVTFAGNVTLNGFVYNNSFALTALAVGANALIAPASNPNGMILSNLDATYLCSANGQANILAKSSPPASFVDGDGIGTVKFSGQSSGGAASFYNYQLINPMYIAPGKGLYLYLAAGTVFVGFPQITGTYQS